MEHGRHGEVVNLNLFKHPFPCRLNINDEFIPNPVLDLRLMSLFMVEHFVVALDQDGPTCDTFKEVPNFDFCFTIFLINPLSKHGLIPVKAIIIASSNPTKFMHDICGPSPCPPSLNAILEIMFDRFTHVWEAKDTLLGVKCRRNASPPFFNCPRFVLKGLHETTLETNRAHNYPKDSLAINLPRVWPPDSY